MNMTDAAFFLKVVECGSFSKAAEELYVSPQAVSQHIKNLEEAYKTILFERKPALKLTPAGEIMLQAIQEIMRCESQLRDKLNMSSNDYIGEITIGLPANRSTAFANEFVPRFSSLYPNVSVNLIEQFSEALFADIANNKIDLGLPLISNTTVRPDPSYLEIVQLEAETLYLVISDELLQKKFPDRYPACKEEFRAGVSLFDFADLPMFLHPSNSPFHRELLNSIKARGITPFLRVQTSLTSSLVSLCAKGYGILFSPTMLLKYMYESQPYYFLTLNMFPVIEYAGARKTFLVYHKKKLLTKQLKDAIEIIRQIFSEHQEFDRHIQSGL